MPARRQAKNVFWVTADARWSPSRACGMEKAIRANLKGLGFGN